MGNFGLIGTHLSYLLITFLNGMGYDFEAFKAEVDEIHNSK